MAGFKQLILEMMPVGMYSFDGEQVDRDTRYINDEIIIDETRNQDGNITVETYDFPPYRAGTPGHVPLDHYDQKSLRFCPGGAMLAAEAAGYSRFPKGMITVKNNLGFDFSSKEFTYAFFIKQGNVDWSTQGNRHFTDVIFDHDGICRVTQSYDWWNSGSTIWGVNIPSISGGSIGINGSIGPGLSGLSAFIVIRFKKFVLDVFKDGNLIYRKDFRSSIDQDSFTLEGSSKDLTIGGAKYPINSDLWSDRCCRPTELDQFTVFNRGITDLEIAKLYRRIFPYTDMVLKDNPRTFYEMADDTVVDWVLNSSGHTNSQLTIYGEITNTIVRQEGPMPFTSSILFRDGVSLKTNYSWNDENILLPLSNTSNFTMMMYFKLDHSDTGVLISQQSDKPTYEGFSLWVNSRNQTRFPGGIELVFNDNEPSVFVTSISTIQWQHLVIRKTGTFYDIWINGDHVLEHHEHITKTTLSTTVGTSLLASHLNVKPISAYMSNFIVYTHALSDIKIMAFMNYDKIYTIRGTVTMNGAPASATVRIYNHRTGELMCEQQSDGETGVYNISLFDNSAVDVVVFDRDNMTVKLRAYGPIVPYEFDDNPYIP